ncbi:MAG: hypothetical protein WCX61_00600 [Candidatus Peribacteraceae bacterium]
MRSFFLDIASHNGFLACATEHDIISVREVDTRIRDHELVLLVEELLKEAEWKYADLTRIACVVGPGGFTSLRVAVTFANTLIDQLGIEGAGIHLSDLHRVRAEVSEPRLRESKKSAAAVRLPQLDALWLHATKRDSFFIRGFGKYEKIWPESILLPIEEAKEKIPQGAIWMGELLDEQRNTLAPLRLQEAALQPISSILPSFLVSQRWNTVPLQPWYGRSW